MLCIAMNRKRLFAGMAVIIAFVAGIWGWHAYTHRATPDRAAVESVFKKVCHSVQSSDGPRYDSLVSDPKKYPEYMLLQWPINPHIDASQDISVVNSKAYVRARLWGPGTPWHIVMEFEKKDGQWLFTGRFEVHKPFRIPPWSSIWRHVTKWF